jgi:hypothetical protein
MNVVRACVLGLLPVCATVAAALAAAVEVPRTWDEAALAEWATPVAGLNVRPAHFPEADYYRAPVDNLRTYPVYYPGREPDGYWDMLQKVGPQPLIEPAKLTSDEDWIRAGKRVFDELDTIGFRTFDPKAIALARTVDVFARRSVKPPSDGTLDDLRWVPTSKGVALSLVNCKECHIRVEPDGNVIPGAPKNVPGSPLGVFGIGIWGASPLPLPGHTLNLSLWRLGGALGQGRHP